LDAPAFLLGAERAGTFLLGQALSAHPGVYWCGEFDWALAWRDGELGDWPPQMSYWQMLSRAPRARELRIRIDPTLRVPHLMRSIWAQQAHAGNGRLGLASAESRYRELFALWPNARFFYVAHAPGAGQARQRESMREWRSLASEIPATARAEIRYDELLRDLPRAIALACEVFGLPHDDSLLRSRHSLEASAPASAARPSLFRRIEQTVAQRLRSIVPARQAAPAPAHFDRSEHPGGVADARVEQPHDSIEAQGPRDETVAVRMARELRDANAQNIGVTPQALANREQPSELGARLVFGTGGVRHTRALRSPRAPSESSIPTEIPRDSSAASSCLENCEEFVETT
jgi:hypothetical protein